MIKILEMESSKGWGGQEKRTVRLVNNLPSDEYQVYWAVEQESHLFKKRDEIAGNFFTFKLNRIYNIKTIFSLCKFVKSNNIDIISTHSGKDAWIGSIVGKLTKTKVIRVRHLIVPITSPTSYNLSSKVVAVSKQVQKELQEQGVKPEKLLTIYTGIDTTKFVPEKEYNLRKELHLEEDTILVGIVAVLRRAKRHQELLETFSKIENKKARLIIVGDGPQYNNLIEYAKKLNIQNRVIFLGHREDINLLLPNFDIFTLTSEHEALGTSLLEAQSCGVCVVASNVGGIPETLKEGKTGFLFNNFDELKQYLEKLLDDENLRKALGQNARENILANFSVTKMLSDTTRLYKEILQ
jgi:L-malate glycosyltransferase